MNLSVPRRLYRGLVLLYEDADIMAVDKPPGLLSIAAGSESEKTAYWILCEYLRKKGERRQAAVVHRLDRETSGVMIFAKSDQIKRKLMENWNETVVERLYAALIEGELPQSEGIIDAPLTEDSRGRVSVSRGHSAGRVMPAVTRWTLIKTGGGFSLVSVRPDTGRHNQIRVHLSSLGHPVAGDRKYGAKTDPLGRLCLHAQRLVFRHPRDGRLMEFDVKPPESFYPPPKTRSPSRRPVRR
jgi:23S rRNA pseudouridine1911/1915/1917 synthase